MRRVEHELYEGWIARDRAGNEIGGKGFRWTSRSVARSVCLETDLIEDMDKRLFGLYRSTSMHGHSGKEIEKHRRLVKAGLVQECDARPDMSWFILTDAGVAVVERSIADRVNAAKSITTDADPPQSVQETE